MLKVPGLASLKLLGLTLLLFSPQHSQAQIPLLNNLFYNLEYKDTLVFRKDLCKAYKYCKPLDKYSDSVTTFSSNPVITDIGVFEIYLSNYNILSKIYGDSVFYSISITYTPGSKALAKKWYKQLSTELKKSFPEFEKRPVVVTADPGYLGEEYVFYENKAKKQRVKVFKSTNNSVTVTLLVGK